MNYPYHQFLAVVVLSDGCQLLALSLSQRSVRLVLTRLTWRKPPKRASLTETQAQGNLRAI
jgi:hypothetical protein